MKETIGETSPQLNKLFESVERDTPDLTREELARLIAVSEPSSALPSMRHNTTLLTRKGIVMSLFTALIVGVTYFVMTPDRQQTTSVVDAASSGRSSVTSPHHPTPGDAVVTTVSDGEDTKQPLAKKELTAKRRGTIDPRSWERFIQKPVDVSAFNPVNGQDKYSSLGLWQTDSGEVVYYHHYLKLGMPMWRYISFYEDASKDSLLPVLGNRSYYPEYVTDSRGYIMMHYITNPAKGGGYSISLNLSERDMMEQIKDLNYYGLESTQRNPIVSDSKKDILTIRLVIKRGIIRLDTVITGKKSDQEPLNQAQRGIEAECVRRDSVIKVGLGGMAVIEKDFALDLSDTDDPLVAHVLSEFGTIATNGKSELQILSAKIKIVNELMDTEPTLEGKLRLEQLLIRLYYEAEIEQGKTESDKVQSSVDLIPVIVRPSSGLKQNTRFDNGLIFWYRESDTLREVLNLPTNAVKPNEPVLRLSIQPNPAKHFVNVDYEMETDGPLRLSLVEITGKQVYSEAWKSSGGTGRKAIDVRSYPPGIYMLVIDTEKGSIVRQVVITK